VSRPELLTPAELDAWLGTHPSWRAQDAHLVARLDLPYERGIEVLAATEPDVARLNHHPTVTLGYHEVTIELWTHDKGGVTSLDLTLAECFDRAATGS
jgi:4a-hydroxytetrahydrobiopterin dehydratase